jgi:two-component system, cell cycle response regulator
MPMLNSVSKLSQDEGQQSQAVLVAEDDPVFRHLLDRQLREWGYRVITVTNGQEAWDALQKPGSPDLLILDWMMPSLDGVELCRRIRQEQNDRYQYVLLLTGKDEKQDVIDGLNSGADDYLTKPFDIRELRARLRAGKRILLLQRELIQAREALRFEASHDALTGLWSRGATLQLLAVELQRCARSNNSTGILMVDLDHFKKVNDTYGHLTGDEVLKEAAFRIGQAVRSYDFVGRYGGEEFLAILTNCTLEDLRIVAERIRVTVADLPIRTKTADVKATVSIGGVVSNNGAHELEFLAAADAALYEAKRIGRNRVVIGPFNSSSALSQSFKSINAVAHA